MDRVLYHLIMRNGSTCIPVIRTVAYGGIVATNSTYAFTFVGCVIAEGTSRRLTLCIPTTPTACIIQPKE